MAQANGCCMTTENTLAYNVAAFDTDIKKYSVYLWMFLWDWKTNTLAYNVAVIITDIKKFYSKFLGLF